MLLILFLVFTYWCWKYDCRILKLYTPWILNHYFHFLLPTKWSNNMRHYSHFVPTLHGHLHGIHTKLKNILYLLTPWCRVLLEKLTGLQLVKKFPAFHGTRRFITALTSVRHLSLSWASPIQSIWLYRNTLIYLKNFKVPKFNGVITQKLYFIWYQNGLFRIGPLSLHGSMCV